MAKRSWLYSGRGYCLEMPPCPPMPKAVKKDGHNHNLYVKVSKPVPAIQWTGKNTDDLVALVRKYKKSVYAISAHTVIDENDKDISKLTVYLSKDSMGFQASIGDYLVIDPDRDSVYTMREALFKLGFASLQTK